MTSRKTLTLDKVLDAASELIDEKGLTYLTMPHLATALHVRSQSLYYYVSNRRELLSLVAAKRLHSLREKLMHSILGLTGKAALLKFADVTRDFLLQDKAMSSIVYSLNEMKPEIAINDEIQKIIEMGRQLDGHKHNVSVHVLLGAVLGYVFFDRSDMFTDESKEEANQNYHDMILRLVDPQAAEVV
ncbi:MAG: TetR/AcrR family transcriptional regulator [Lactobacillus sp.]|jgi:AcrR family transcriptional regulator|nr:TetR/AcrR family transcriptional regulator [Lactobacillus sp.]MCI1481777.1 TetR/AcrR family transcriptional regulator [Lactobacillus sp.]